MSLRKPETRCVSSASGAPQSIIVIAELCKIDTRVITLHISKIRLNDIIYQQNSCTGLGAKSPGLPNNKGVS